MDLDFALRPLCVREGFVIGHLLLSSGKLKGLEDMLEVDQE